jgi:ABC-type bacteriocin/lantibiotic exporter with double-glycine peptidase domain
LVQLGRLTGVDIGLARARLALASCRNPPGAEPLELFSQAAALVGLRAKLVRLSVADAIGWARRDTPLVAWDSAASRWLIIRRSGLFQAQIADQFRPGLAHSITRRDLASRLGVNTETAAVDFAVVHSERPADVVATEPAAHPDAPLAGGTHATGGHPPKHAHPVPWHRFGALLTGEIRDIRVFLVFSLVAGLLYLSVPLAVDALVSNLAFGNDARPFIQAVVMISLGLLLSLALAAAVRAFKHYLAEVIQRRIFVRLVADLGHRLPRVKPESLDGQHGPELVNRFLDVVTLQKSSAGLLMDGLDAVFSIAIGMVLLGLFHPLLLVFVLLLVGLLWVVLFVMARGAVRTSIAESYAKFAVVHWFEEIARHPNLFKGPGGYALAMDRADQLARTYVDARRSHFRILLRQICGMLTLEVLATVGLLMVGGILVLRQELTLGQLVASELTVATIVAALAKLPKQLEVWYDAMAAMDKVGHLVDLETEREDGDTPGRRTGPAEVRVQDATFGFHADRPLFSHLSFQLAPGESGAVVGAQGSGASTLLSLVFGLRRLEHGFITVDGLDVRSWNLERLRSEVLLLRVHDLMDGTVADNIRLGRADLSHDDVRVALERAGLFEDIMALPQGLNSPLMSGGLPLSSRQRIRLLVARALAQKPRLLLVDEMLDGLDPETWGGLAECIFNPQAGWTVLISTRDADVLRRCRHVITLTDGRLTDGTPLPHPTSP